MFSGIVQGARKVAAVEKGERAMSIEIDLGELADDLRPGASVAVAGVCLTMVRMDGDRARFDIMGETLEKTTLGSLAVGDMVNIERSLRAGDEIGGHRVSGHVTGRARIARIVRDGENCAMTFRSDPSWMPYILPKGFIALDGCSLTIADVGRDEFSVHFIPETLRITTFGASKQGDEINLELDPQTVAIVDTVRSVLSSRHGTEESAA